MTSEERRKSELIAELRSIILKYDKDQKSWADGQTGLFIGSILWLLNEYEHNVIDND